MIRRLSEWRIKSVFDKGRRVYAVYRLINVRLGPVPGNLIFWDFYEDLKEASRDVNELNAYS